MRYPSDAQTEPGPELGPERGYPRQQSGEISSIIVSTVCHVALLIVMRLLFLAADDPVSRIVTDATFTDDLPSVIVTELAEIDTVVPDEPNPVVAVDIGAELVPQVSGDVTAKLAVNTNPVAAANANNIGEPGALTGVDAAVADIQERVTNAGGRNGEVQFSLSWKDRNDLDLHVIVPQGTRIHFDHRKSPCKGELDVDMNVRPESNEPVENVRWLKGKARSGRYTVLVHWFRPHAPKRELPFELLVKLGSETELVKGKVRRWGKFNVLRFRYVRPAVSAARRKILMQKYQRLQVEEEKTASALLQEAKKTMDLQKLAVIAFKYPHTDASLEALQLLPGKPEK